MSKKKHKTAPDIINNIRLCDSCQNCIKLHDKQEVVKTEHFSGDEYDWGSFNEPICKILAVQLNNVSKCNKYLEKQKKVLN